MCRTIIEKRDCTKKAQEWTGWCRSFNLWGHAMSLLFGLISNQVALLRPADADFHPSVRPAELRNHYHGEPRITVNIQHLLLHVRVSLPLSIVSFFSNFSLFLSQSVFFLWSDTVGQCLTNIKLTDQQTAGEAFYSGSVILSLLYAARPFVYPRTRYLARTLRESAFRFTVLIVKGFE